MLFYILNFYVCTCNNDIIYTCITRYQPKGIVSGIADGDLLGISLGTSLGTDDGDLLGISLGTSLGTDEEGSNNMKDGF